MILGVLPKIQEYPERLQKKIKRLAKKEHDFVNFKDIGGNALGIRGFRMLKCDPGDRSYGKRKRV